MSALYELAARIDSNSAAAFDKDIKALLEQGIKHLRIDMSNTVYMSSAGLRVLLSTKKALDRKGGSLVLIHVKSTVKEIFDVTGFSGFLVIED